MHAPYADKKADWIVLSWGLTRDGLAAQKRGVDLRRIPYPYWVHGHNYATHKVSEFWWSIPAHSLDDYRYDMTAATYIPRKEP